MGTPYPGNAGPLAQPAQDSAAGPVIRTIRLSDLHDALRLGWEDFKAVPSHAIILCVIYPILGLVLARTVLGYSVLPLLFPLAAGFALLGPFAALGLYELSRRRERGETASAWDAIDVFRSPSFGAMLGLGTLLFALFVTWVATAQAIYVAAFGYESAAGIPDFVTRVLTTPQGWWLIVVGCGVGLLFAVLALCVSVVSFPLMLDRHAGAGDAMVTSLRAVARKSLSQGHRARSQSATAAAPSGAGTALRRGFPGGLVSLAAQGRRISLKTSLATKPSVVRCPTVWRVWRCFRRHRRAMRTICAMGRAPITAMRSRPRSGVDIFITLSHGTCCRQKPCFGRGCSQHLMLPGHHS